MKAEVLFPILLLALGAAVWTWHPNRDRAAENAPSTLPINYDPAKDFTRHASASVHLENAQALLAESIQELRSSGPLVAQVKLQINLLDREFHGTGQYCQAGDSLPKARWDLTLNGSKDLFVSQVFDGRFFYRLEILGDQRTLHYVDLSEARRLAPTVTPGVAAPTAWFTTGTLATMLEQLLATFEFDDAVEREQVGGQSGQGIDLLRVRGKWSRDGLKQLLRDQIPDVTGNQHIPWDRLPGQLPHAVEISFGSDEYLRQFPYQLVFYQFIPTGKGEFERKQIFKLQLHQVEKREAIADEQFGITADELLPVDQTKEYLERIKLFTQYPVKD